MMRILLTFLAIVCTFMPLSYGENIVVTSAYRTPGGRFLKPFELRNGSLPVGELVWKDYDGDLCVIQKNGKNYAITDDTFQKVGSPWGSLYSDRCNEMVDAISGRKVTIELKNGKATIIRAEAAAGATP